MLIIQITLRLPYQLIGWLFSTKKQLGIVVGLLFMQPSYMVMRTWFVYFIVNYKIYFVMKKSMLTFGIAVASVAGLFAFTNTAQTAITGKVVPGEGAETVWAISATDSTKGTVSSGTFTLDVKPGTYKVIVDAKDPYKDVTLENLEVKQDQPLNVGEIVLQK
jgi:hypothetical protein